MGVARQVANHSVVVTYYIVLEKLKVIMKKAILALVVISTVTLLAHADKPKPVGKVPNISKPVGKVPNISTRPLKPRKYPIHPRWFSCQFTCQKILTQNF